MELEPSFCHLVLTRFNCRFAASWTKVAIDPDWLGPRFELFDRYCLPTMRAQTCKDFKWVLFFDAETPSPFRERALALQDERTSVVLVETLTGELIRETIHAHTDAGATHLVTTRLDNDDGLASDALERVQGAFTASPSPYFINLDEGLIVAEERYYQRHDPSNAFLTFVEPRSGEPMGVWHCEHNNASAHAPVHPVSGPPAWLQVVHGGNVSNKVRGTRLLADSIDASRFRCDLRFPSHESRMEVWKENLFIQPVRSIRDRAAELKRGLFRMVNGK
ncbi:MAG: glycosyltransferase [Planctomycetota bacterium]